MNKYEVRSFVAGLIAIVCAMVFVVMIMLIVG